MTRNFDQICSQFIGEMIAPNTGAQAAVAQNAQQKPAAATSNPNDEMMKQLAGMMQNQDFVKKLQELLKQHAPTPQQPNQQQTAPQQPNQQQAQQPNAAAPKK